MKRTKKTIRSQFRVREVSAGRKESQQCMERFVKRGESGRVTDGESSNTPIYIFRDIISAVYVLRIRAVITFSRFWMEKTIAVKMAGSRNR